MYAYMLTDVSSKWLGKMGQMHFAYNNTTVNNQRSHKLRRWEKLCYTPHDIWMKLNKIFDLIQNNFQNECNEE